MMRLFIEEINGIKNYLDKNNEILDSIFEKIRTDNNFESQTTYYDNSGLFDDFLIFEMIVIRSVFNELSILREYELNEAIYNYLFSQIDYRSKFDYEYVTRKYSSYLKIVQKYESDYDKIPDKIKKDYHDKYKPNNFIEYFILYGSIEGIPEKYIIKMHKSFKNEPRIYFKPFSDAIKLTTLPCWNDVEYIRKVNNAFKHRRSFKNWLDDHAEVVGERYNPSIHQLYKMIESTEIFLNSLYDAVAKFVVKD